MKNPWRLYKNVLPQHTDHAGVMWHGTYISFLEEARVEALSNVGLPYVSLTSNGMEMPVVNLQIRYMKAVFHGEKLVLKSYCLPPNGLRLPWKTLFLRDGELMAQANVDLVLIKVGRSGKKLLRKFPADLSKALLDLQKGPLEKS